jgi:hypothetical protein
VKTSIESSLTPDGRVLFRMSCPRCPRVGAWLVNLSDAERSAEKHDKAHADEERKAS